MAQLKNRRHEQFAQELVIAARTGGTNGEAYTRAGYSSTGKAAGASAARMLADDSNGIARRVQEIIGRSARRVKKIETGGPGDFGACETTEDVVRALLSDQSPAQALELLDTMREEVERYAADLAEVVVAPLAPRDETALSLAALRPTWKHRRN
jgi:hypothetical protein